MNWRDLRAGAVCIASLLVASPAFAQADRHADLVSLWLGAYNVDNSDTELAGRIEYRPGVRALDGVGAFHGVGPLLGVMANVDGGVYGYGGVVFDFRLGKHVLIWPSLAVGAYSDGGSIDLGGVIEFQSGLTVAYQFANESHLGLGLTHISNAGIYDRNPGVNSLWLSYAIPLNGGR